jgi:bifunctional DNA-binding transcriptional regulator/antitoxin component of YhaV-PrlF toxin-antitoxin module
MTASEIPATRSQQVVAALSLPHLPRLATESVCPLPLPELHNLSRDGSLLYGIGPVDESGRVAGQDIVTAMGWRPGDRIEIITIPQAIILRASPSGLLRVPRRPRVVIPAAVRHLRGMSAGENVLLVAAPDHGLIIVHTLRELDDMLSAYHSPAPEPGQP